MCLVPVSASERRCSVGTVRLVWEGPAPRAGHPVVVRLSVEEEPLLEDTPALKPPDERPAVERGFYRLLDEA